MATESNTSFYLEDILSSGLYRNAISFQSGPLNNTPNIIPFNSYYEGNNSTEDLMFRDSSSIISSGSPTISAPSNSSGSLLLNSVPGLKHDAGLAVEWTEEEQFQLEEGLVMFKDEPCIMKYIKIAAILPDKTVRDVALRCRWLTRKRRKQEESNLRRKGNYRKDKFGESSSKTNLPSAPIPNAAPYSFQQNQMDQNQHFKLLNSEAEQLLEQNRQVFHQIDYNMNCLKDNIDLFCRARDNINDINLILNHMGEFSSKMRHVQDLPVSIDQNLMNCILPRTTL